MGARLLDELRLLSERIKDEEMTIAVKEAAQLFLSGEDGTGGEGLSQEKVRYGKSACLLLHVLRICLCLKLMEQGDRSCAALFRKDWETVLTNLTFLEYTLKVSGEILSDAVDLILLLAPEQRNHLIQQLSFKERLCIKKRNPLRFELVETAFHMADYCLDTDRIDEYDQIITNLVRLSGERNVAHPDKHRLVTLHALHCISDRNRTLAGQICDAQRTYFDHINDLNAAAFFWHYALARIDTGREQEALPFLQRCRTLCMELEGERSWLGARAGVFSCFYQIQADHSGEREAYLWDVLRKIEDGFYSDMDQSAEDIAARIRRVLLSIHVDQQNTRGLLAEFERFKAYCVSAENTNRTPELTVRQAENLLSGYYFDAGDYLQAANHALNALYAIPPNGLPKEPSDALICSNLLLIYTALNDFVKMQEYLQKLSDLMETCKDIYLVNRASAVIGTAYKKLQIVQPDQENDRTLLERDRELLDEFYQSIRGHTYTPFDSAEENVTFALTIVNMCLDILDSYTSDRKELFRLREIADFFLRQPEHYPFLGGQKGLIYALLAQIAWQSDAPDVLELLEQCLACIQAVPGALEAKISIFRLAAIIYYNYHREDRALTLIDQVLYSMREAWQKAAAYLNDHRVCQVLSFIQLYFNICYAILRMIVKSETLYERVLQFKDLPALAGRERNRLLRLTPVDPQLRERITAVQNRLAGAALNDFLRGTDTVAEIAKELEGLEMDFAEKFPQNLRFQEITFQALCGKLTDETAIIEYFFTMGADALSGRPSDQAVMELDIFITTKKNHTAVLHHLKQKRADILLRQTEEFIQILQSPGDISTSGQKSLLRGELYRKLLAPALPFLDGIVKLYIAPDDELCNLPFEILFADGSGLLQDQYKICRITCGRDLLFFHDSQSAVSSNFVLGDPNYDAEGDERRPSQTRGQDGLKPLSSLPFSGIEAQRIGQRCHSAAYSGDAATKYALSKALPCRIVHLATHGGFDNTTEIDSLYTSYLVFAGYNRWVSDQTESNSCGNGVLTADEISRMDLSETELVVLSACQSGMGDTTYGTIRGLLSAFAAAGARWVISHMWEASDFSAPILMDAFYAAYLEEKKEVPQALQAAKDYLRTVTIGSLRANGWFDLPEDDRFSQEIREAIAAMREWPDDARPFEDEFFWGGFTVHQFK